MSSRTWRHGNYVMRSDQYQSFVCLIQVLHSEEFKDLSLSSWARNRDRSCCPDHKGQQDSTGQRVQKEKELSTVNAWSIVYGLKGNIHDNNT